VLSCSPFYSSFPFSLSCSLIFLLFLTLTLSLTSSLVFSSLALALFLYYSLALLLSCPLTLLLFNFLAYSLFGSFYALPLSLTPLPIIISYLCLSLFPSPTVFFSLYCTLLLSCSLALTIDHKMFPLLLCFSLAPFPIP